MSAATRSRSPRSRSAIGRDEASFDPAALARQLIEAAGLPPAALDGTQRRALAWALKDACYAAWSSEPRRAVDAAHVLRALDGADDEIAALADWTAGIAQVTQGQMAEAVSSFDRAAEAFRALGRGQHAAETQVPKIMALSMLGRHAEAAACAEATQREFVALKDLRAAAKVSLNLGSLYLRQDAYAPSARHYREAAVLCARVGDMEHSVMADIGVADALTATGDFGEALHMYARARMRAEARGFPVLAAVVEESVALLNLARGRYRDALAGLEDSRRRYESLGLPQHLAIAEKQLADAYREVRLLTEALALYERAFVQFEALDMPQERAWTLVQIGRVQAALGRRERADDALALAAPVFEAQANHAGAATVELARAELALASRSAEAVAFAERAAQGFELAQLAEGRARADAVRAQALLQDGRVDEARVLLEATLERARRLQLLPAQWRCLTGLGLVAQAQGRTEAARRAFEDAVEMFEDQWRALPGDEIRSALLADQLLPYGELLRLALDAHARGGTPEDAAAVLERLEQFRARTLAERLMQAPESDVAPAEQALRGRLNWLYRRLRRAQDEGEASAALADELKRAERELLERVRRRRLTSRAATAATGADFSAAELSRALDADSALVEYGVIDDELFACVASADGVEIRRRLARWPDVQRAVQSARFQIETLRFGAAPVAQHLESLARRARQRMREVHALLWAPLVERLAHYRRILVVPHGETARLPFAALADGERELADMVALAVAPSARIALHGLRRTPARPARALVLGESSLLHAEREARSVAAHFPRCALFTGAEATLDALRKHADRADLIHLACHAQFRSDNPMFSALHLADGALTAEAIEQLRLRPGIVVLSACETGLAQSGRGDEMVGLVRAFLLAGAARIVASLWPIDDATTAEFMMHFYAALMRGSPPSAAIAAAQNLLRQRHPHPYFWAGFTLYGGW